MTPLEALNKYFGYSAFRKGQEEIITTILNKQNTVTVLPTGAGKSICYQIPALVSDSFSIVISPLIALMKDQVDSLNKTEEIAAFINSTMSFRETEEVLAKLTYGKLKMLYAAPERLESVSFSEKIKKLNPSFLFVDEAHCISEWGHNFRPSYIKIKEFIDYVQIKNISAFTATATPEVVEDIIKYLGLKEANVFVKGFERENLNLNVIAAKKKKELCIELISIYKTPAIIYTASRKKAEEVSEFLNMNKVKCAYYHAGVSSIERKNIQEDFINDKLPVIAATNAFGMGIDKKDIHLIIHYNTPGSIENYYQEIGRAGRDGKESFAFLLHSDNDINIQNYFLSMAHPDKTVIQNIYDAVCDYGKVALGNITEKEIPINMEFLSAACKREINKGLLHSALKILEHGGYLKELSDYDKQVTFQFLLNKDKLKELVKKTININLKEIVLLLLREFGSNLFSAPQTINIPQMTALCPFSEEEFEQLLITLDNLGIGAFNRSAGRENIKMLSPRVPVSKLKLDYKGILERYLNLQQKIDKMVEYAYTNDCRFKFILKYFGEDVSDYRCGKCDRCIEGEKIPIQTAEYVKEIMLRTIIETGNEINESSLHRVIQGTAKRDGSRVVSTYGTCKNYTREELRNILEYTISTGLVGRKKDNNRVLFVREAGYSLMKEKGLLDVQKADYDINLELFHLLKDARKKASQKFMQTGYLICPDEVLREISLNKPSTREDLLVIKGFNERMFNKLGKEFLEIINEFIERHSKIEVEKNKLIKESARKLPNNIKETYNLLIKGYSLKDISALRQTPEAIISMQIESIIDYIPDIDTSGLFEEDELNKIYCRLKEGLNDLKELKKSLPPEISYAQIRIAIAKYKTSSSSFSASLPHSE